jgi:uncharacterized protein YceK
MFKKYILLVIILCASVGLAGCGTIGARATEKNPPPFAGLRMDFATLDDMYTNKEHVDRGWAEWLGMPLMSGIVLMDMPVSAAFDVYALPWDAARGKKKNGSN